VGVHWVHGGVVAAGQLPSARPEGQFRVQDDPHDQPGWSKPWALTVGQFGQQPQPLLQLTQQVLAPQYLLHPRVGHWYFQCQPVLTVD